MGCEEKGRLIMEYHRAVSEWSHVTADSQRTPWTLIKHANKLRDVALKAKKAVMDHVAEHAC